MKLWGQTGLIQKMQRGGNKVTAKYLRQSNTKKKNTGRRKGRILPIIAKLTETLGKLLKRMEKAA